VGVDRDALGIGAYADRLEPQVLYTRATTRRDEQVVAAQLAAALELDDVVRVVAAGARC
jgi:hypothetical protein